MSTFRNDTGITSNLDKTEVVVWGLVSRSDLNGKKGRVMNELEDGRWRVKLDDGKLLSCKLKNLQPLSPHRQLYPDDIAAFKRREPHHVVPADWPCDFIARCPVCRKSHLRNFCCRRKPNEFHVGELELISWRYFPKPGWGWNKGFGGWEFDNEEEALWEFENKDHWDYNSMYQFSPSSFRWTCCGLTGSHGTEGCEHHGLRGKPCRCLCCISFVNWKNEISIDQDNRMLPVGGRTERERVEGLLWEPRLNPYFPKDLRVKMKTLLLCHQRKIEGKITIANIPKDILMNQIIPFWFLCYVPGMERKRTQYTGHGEEQEFDYYW